MKKFMKKLIRRIRCLNISTRLIGAFFLISIFPLLILSLYFYQAHSRSVTDKLSESNITTLLQISKTIDATLENYQYLCGKLSIDSMVQSSLSLTGPLPTKDREQIALHMDNLLNESIVYPPFMKTIKIIDNDGDLLYDMGYDNISADAYRLICSTIDSRKPDDSWFYVDTYMGQKIIILGRRINSINDMNTSLGYTLLFISEQLFTKEILSASDLSGDSIMAILDTDGNLLTSSDSGLPRNKPLYKNELLEKIQDSAPDGVWDQHFIYEGEGGSYLVTYTQNRALGSYLVSCMPFSYIQEESYKIIPTVFLFIFIVLGICAVLGMLIYYTLMTPIRSAVRVCEEVGRDNTSGRILDDADDEITFLSQQINQMLDKNEELLAIVKENEERKRILELQMLQYQINPHFLFNTLGTLKWIASLNQIPVLEEMITALSEILKNTLIQTAEYIPLSEELRMLDFYISIQKVRYVNKFEIAYLIPESLKSFLIPRFVLQPLVENSIYHGTYDNGKQILISISAARRGSWLLIQIADNGKGFDHTHADPAKTSSKSYSIGISNVRERIMRVYGAESALEIKSIAGKGTCCTIRIPYKQDTKQEALTCTMS